MMLLKLTDVEVANIIALLSAIGTVGALWYAIRQGIKNSKKINDLAEITKQLADQNKLILDQNKLILAQNDMQRMVMKTSVRPDFLVWIPSPLHLFQLRIAFKNIGQKATITDVKVDTDEIILDEIQFPIILLPNAESSVGGSFKTKGKVGYNWTISIYYHDTYNYKYQHNVDGFAQNVLNQIVKELI